MKKIDKDGLLLCELQANTFELSVSESETSSEIFIRRFMNSGIAKKFDSTAILETNIQPKDVLDRIKEEYGESKYGTVRYSKAEIYWIGYIYRYFAYTFSWTSVKIYKTVKPKELRGLYYPYHSLDPAQAIERILESKGFPQNEDEELDRQYRIYRKIRNRVSG